MVAMPGAVAGDELRSIDPATLEVLVLSAIRRGRWGRRAGGRGGATPLGHSRAG